MVPPTNIFFLLYKIPKKDKIAKKSNFVTFFKISGDQTNYFRDIEKRQESSFATF